MNLNDLFDILNCENRLKELNNIKSKRELYHILIPTEARMLNNKLWKDKSRRSRFFKDSKKEPLYIEKLVEEFINNTFLIPRFENNCKKLILNHTDISTTFHEIVDNSKIKVSTSLINYLSDNKPEYNSTKQLAFLVIYSMVQKDINNVYRTYLHKLEAKDIIFDKEISTLTSDDSLFISEYPPGLGVYQAGELIYHTWVIKNTGNVVWEKRYLECVSATEPLNKKDLNVPLDEYVYPGETTSATVSFFAPLEPGSYKLVWKAKNKDGFFTFPQKTGVGLHFFVESINNTEDISENDYRIISEEPTEPEHLKIGNKHTHTWLIENTGNSIWDNFFCECINGESFNYSKKELRMYFNSKIYPKQQATIKVEFATPPDEGSYCLIWRIMTKYGAYAFGNKRRLEAFIVVER